MPQEGESWTKPCRCEGEVWPSAEEGVLLGGVCMSGCFSSQEEGEGRGEKPGP